MAVVSKPVNAHQSFTTRPAPIDLDLQHVGDDLLVFAIDVWVYDSEGDVVVTRDDIPEGG